MDDRFDRSVEDFAYDADGMSHCSSCRPRELFYLHDQEEFMEIPITHWGVVEVRRYAQLCLEIKTNCLEMSSIDLVSHDVIPDHMKEYMPALGFNYTLMSCARDEPRLKWFCRALSANAVTAVDYVSVNQPEVLEWNKFYSTDHFPMLKQIKCIGAINNFLAKMLLVNYEILEHRDPIHRSLLSIEERNLLFDQHARSVRLHRCNLSCEGEALMHREKLTVLLDLKIPYEGSFLKIKVQRTYRLSTKSDYWDDCTLMRMELSACDIIKNLDFPKPVCDMLVQMGFSYSVRSERYPDNKQDIWFIRGLIAFHQEPLLMEDVYSMKLVDAMQMYEASLFTKLRKMLRIAILSSDYFDKKIESSLELAFVDMIDVERIRYETRPYLTLLGFRCTVTFYYNDGRVEQKFVRVLESKRCLGSGLDFAAIQNVFMSVKVDSALYFDIFKPVSCINKYERVISYAFPDVRHTFSSIPTLQTGYPAETAVSYFRRQHPPIFAYECASCLNLGIGDPKLKMSRRMDIRLPSIGLNTDMKRYFLLSEIASPHEIKDMELDVLDFVDADSIGYDQMSYMLLLGFNCELLATDCRTGGETRYIVRGLFGNCLKTDLDKYNDYSDCLDRMQMFGGVGIGDLHPVHCPQSVIYMLDAYGFKDMIVKRSSLIILEGGEGIMEPAHHR